MTGTDLQIRILDIMYLALTFNVRQLYEQMVDSYNV